MNKVELLPAPRLIVLRRQALDRYRVNMVLVPPETPLIELLSSDSHWQVVYHDKQSVLLARDAAVTKPPLP